MSDIKKGLPVRSEVDGADERVQVKIVDSTNPDTQQAVVDTDSNLHVEGHGNDPAGLDTVIRTSELGHTAIDGIYDATNNTDPSNAATIHHVRAVTPDDTNQTFRSTGATPTVDGLDGTTVHAIDVNSFQMAWDGTGWDRVQKDPDSEGLLVHLADHDLTESNPLPVYITDQAGGDDVHDYDDNGLVDVAAGGTDNHDYTVTALKILHLKQWQGSASSRGKWELQIETGVAAGTFDTIATRFTTESNPSFMEQLAEPIDVAAGIIVRIARTNRDSDDAQCMYSYINGEEVTA